MSFPTQQGSGRTLRGESALPGERAQDESRERALEGSFGSAVKPLLVSAATPYDVVGALLCRSDARR